MISTKGRYALRLMLDLAENGKENSVPLKDIAARQEISKKYLEIIAKDLVTAGFIEGASGKGGGYRLCRTPDEYLVGEIIEQMEGTLASVACLTKGAPDCPKASTCRTVRLWSELDRITYDFLYSKSLSDLLQ